MAEIPELGKHCSKSGCNQLDFLPLWCSHCNQVFCKEHHAVSGHSCSRCPEGKNVKDKSFEEKWWRCSVIGCKNGNDPVHQPCSYCGAHICLQHRHDPPESHVCSSVPQRDRINEQNPAQEDKYKKQLQDAHLAVEKEICGKLQTALSSKKVKDKDMANRLRLMRLKSRAICDPSTPVPASSRAYFDVFPPASQGHSASSVPVYVSRTWSLGRATDAIEKILKLNSTSNQKLGLYVHSTRRIVSNDMSQSVGSLIDSASLMDGETLVLDFLDS